MAFLSRQIFPNDLRPRVAIGFDLPINGEAVFTPNYQTKDAIKNNLINYFLTNPGERPGNPEFGAGLRKYIFTQMVDGNMDYIREDMQEKIATNFPNVALNSIEVFQDPDTSRIRVDIKYGIVNTGINDELELNFA
jgi:phage baseplate assembly protein W